MGKKEKWYSIRARVKDESSSLSQGGWPHDQLGESHTRIGRRADRDHFNFGSRSESLGPSFVIDMFRVLLKRCNATNDLRTSNSRNFFSRQDWPACLGKRHFFTAGSAETPRSGAIPRAPAVVADRRALRIVPGGSRRPESGRRPAPSAWRGRPERVARGEALGVVRHDVPPPHPGRLRPGRTTHPGRRILPPRNRKCRTDAGSATARGTRQARVRNSFARYATP